MSEANKEVLAALEAPFTNEQVRERVGHGGTKLRWVPARVVAQRLDQVLGVGGWDLHVTRIAENTVHAQLSITLPDGTRATRGDYGYETGGSGEALKEASSDALRRVASLFGVARYLYQGENGPSAGAPRPQFKSLVTEQNQRKTDDEVILRAAMDFARSVGEGNCPDHDVAWTLKPSGVSKAGKPYAAFYTCGAKDANGWCRNKPSLKWLAENPIKEEVRVPQEFAEIKLDAPKPTAAELGEELPF